MGYSYYGFGGGGDIMFTLVPLFIIGVIIWMVIAGISQWSKNNNSPILDVEAAVAAKRTRVDHQHHPVGDSGATHMQTTTSYYVTFQVESGDRLEFSVSGREYGQVAEGDQGKLKFQGTRYLEFTRN